MKIKLFNYQKAGKSWTLPIYCLQIKSGKFKMEKTSHRGNERKGNPTLSATSNPER